MPLSALKNIRPSTRAVGFASEVGWIKLYLKPDDGALLWKNELSRAVYRIQSTVRSKSSNRG